MALTIAHGPVGLAARHHWVPEVSEFGLPTFDLNTEPPFPRVKVTKITGWGSLPATDDVREPAQGDIGEVVLPSLWRGKTLTYEGRIEGVSYDDVLLLGSTMRAAFSESTLEGTMMVLPLGGAGMWAGDAPPYFYYRARAKQLDMDADLSDSGPMVNPQFRQGFVLSLALSDPRMYAGTAVEVPTGAFTGARQANVFQGSPLSVLMPGTAPTDPTLYITVPSSGIGQDVTITRSGGRVMKLVGVPEAGDLKIQFHRPRSIVYTGSGTDASGCFDPVHSNWWDAGRAGIPGNNITTTIYNSQGWAMGLVANPAVW